MKLITKETYYLVSVYFLIFILVGISFYYVTKHVISEDFNQKLYLRKEFVLKQLTKSDSLLHYQNLSEHTISIEMGKNEIPLYEIISDTTIYNQDIHQYDVYRQIKFSANIHNKYYSICVRRLLLETESLASALLILTLILFLILLICLFFANQWISKKIWQPFYTTLDKIKRYQFKELQTISFPKTNITEFNELIKVINDMTLRLKNDFYLLKEFTENTSHELQTPLAIIKTRLELLLQSDHLTPLQYKHISISYASANKLAKLNEALGLLTKIENSQFELTEDIDLNQLIENKLSNYEDILTTKSIGLTKHMNNTIKIHMNPILADILIENLITNSIKHNLNNGYIHIELKNNEIDISNTGSPLTVEPSELFQRFSKSNSQSFGLGLSIVKEICRQNNIQITYTYNDSVHSIKLIFKVH